MKSLVLTLIIALSSSIYSASSAAAEPLTMDTVSAASLYLESTQYRIMRKGKRVGTHTLVIRPLDDSLEDALAVSVESRIRITVLKVPVFNFRYQASEIWQNSKLNSVSAETTQKGETWSVNATRVGSVGSEFELERSGKVVKAAGSRKASTSALEYSSNHWHPGVLGSDRIFNTLSGEVDKVSIESLGTQRLSLPGGQVDALHFRYRGGFEADTWYHADGRWLQLEFKGSDGSTISYQYLGENL